MFWKYTINNVYGMIATKKVAEYFLGEGFVRGTLEKAWLYFKSCFFSPLQFVS